MVKSMIQGPNGRLIASPAPSVLVLSFQAMYCLFPLNKEAVVSPPVFDP